MNAVQLRPRSIITLSVAAVISLMVFAWPLIVSPGAHSTSTPWLYALVLPVVMAVVLAEISDGGLDSKTVAMLGVLSAVGVAVRPLGAGAAGIETVFFVLVLGGRVFGPGFGFVLGNTTLFASALLTGGVGPWLPYQMAAAAWVGLGAGLLPSRLRGKWELAMLALYGAVAALAYGLLINLSFWPFALGGGSTSFLTTGTIGENLLRLVLFSLATSLGWDIGRALTTAALTLAAGPLVLSALRRAARKAAFGPRETAL